MKEIFEKEKSIDKSCYQRAMANNLKMLRAKCGMTQEELCSLIGVSRQTIVQAENACKLSWTSYLALVQLFSKDEETLKIMQLMDIYPD